MGRLILFFALFFVALQINAQQYTFAPKQPYTYVYKLDSVQAAFAFKRDIIDTPWLFSNKVDSFLAARPKLAPGMYVLARYQEPAIYYEILNVPFVTMQVNSFNDLVQVRFFDSTWQVDARLQFWVNKQLISFDTACDCYNIGRNKKERHYFIKKQAAFMMGEINGDYKSYTSTPPANYGGNPVISQGYFILNQPKYHAQDSVKLKAYILNPEGAAFTRTLKLYMALEYHPYTRVFMGYVKPASRGAYVHQFKLADTLKIDQQYRLEFEDRGGALLQSTRFLIEDYKLRNSTYSAELEKLKVYKGEKIKLLLHAKDANDLPLTDARVRVRIKLNSFNNFTGKVLFVPNEWYEKLYETFVEMDISKETEIVVPANVLPPMDLHLTAEISFSNASGELKKIEIPFEVVQQNSYYTLSYQEGKVMASYISNGENKPVKAILKGYNNSSLLKIDTLVLPKQMFIDPNCEKYLLQDSLGNDIQWLFLPHMPQPIIVTGDRTHDSIFISSYNPGNFPFYYRIYKNDQLILAGKERNLNFVRVDTSSASYNIIYNFMYKANSQIHESVFSFREKELNVKTNLPNVIFPGQTIAVDINVLNSNREGQPNVNLTAFGINAQFDGNYTPSLPYFGEEKNRIYLKDRTRLTAWPFPNQQKVIYKVSYTTLLKAGFIYNGDYRLRYPNELLFVHSQKINKAQSEFNTMVVGNGKRIEVYAIEIDGNLVYVKGVSSSPKSNWISHGNHQIFLRTKTALYTLPSMNFEDSSRYLISFDTLCLPAGIVKKVMPNHIKFSDEEMARIKQHIFVFNPVNFAQRQQEVYFTQKHQIQSFAVPLASKYLTDRSQYQYFFGLFDYDSINVYSKGVLFQKVRFEPNSKYVYFRERIIREELDSVELPYDFAYFKSQDETFVTQYDTALAIVIPEIAKYQSGNFVAEKERLAIEEKCVFNFRFEPKVNETNVLTHVIFSGLENQLVRNILMINKQEELQSVLNPEIYNNSKEYSVWLKPGEYDFYVTGHKNLLLKYIGQSVLPNGQLLIRLDSNDFQFSCIDLQALVPQAKRLQEIYNMRESMLVNYRKEDYVELREKTPLQISASEDKLPILSGFVFNKYGSALSDVIITLEQSGKVRGISFSDATGGFLIRDVDAGTYQLRLTRYGSCVTIIQQISLQKNKLHNINVRLQDCGFAFENGQSRPTLFFGKSNISQEEYAKYEDSREPIIQGTGMIKGKIVSTTNKQPLDYVSLQLKEKGLVKATVITDDDGEFVFKNLSPGIYELVATYVGYKGAIISNIQVIPNEIRFVNFTMEVSNTMNLQDVVVSNRRRSLVDPAGVRGNVVPENEVMAMSRSVNSISTYSLGVESRNGATPDFRGARADGTAYYIDGVRVNATGSNLPSNAIGRADMVELKVLNSFEVEQKSRLYQMAKNNEVKENRENFRDYAFWVPNLVTNSFGEAHVSITFPDNITRWRNFIIAMDEGLNTKVYTLDIRSYKPLSANLFIPSFALKGDAIYIKGKLNNYTGDSIEVTTSFKLNNSLIQSKQQFLNSGLVEKVLVQTEKTDTLQLSYKLETRINYGDGEKYLLPVLPNGIAQNTIEYYSLNKDTTIQFSTKEEGKYFLSVTNTYSQLIREEIARLQEYQYGCVEQTASKLNALLVSKSLCKLLGDSFLQEELVRTCIKRLETMQQSSGAFGWFSRSGSEMWLTYYVMKSLSDAQKMGYKNKATQQGITYFKKNMAQFNSLDQTRAMLILFDNRVDIEYQDWINKMDEATLPFYERLLLTSLKQKMQLPHFSGFLFEGIQKDKEGSIYWNQPYVDIHQNQSSIGLLVYEVLKFDQVDSSTLAGIRKFYFNEKVYGLANSRNTLESAQVLQAMAKDIALLDKGSIHTTIQLNGKDLGNKFPIRINLSNKASYTLKKSGANANVFVSRKSFEEKPLADELLFGISSYFNQDGRTVDTLKTNFEVEYTVQLKSLKNQEFIMVQIPIIASCNYLNKMNNFGADEIEYHKDRVILYFRKLRAGNYTFKFLLEPRFAGNYTQLPIQVESMYNPEIKGNNLSRKMIVVGQ